MLSPPPPKNALYYPVTSSVALAAIILSLMRLSGVPLDELVMTSLVWEKWQIWRAVTATLLHGSALHLIFNIYWMWTFGTFVEREFGSARCLGIFLLLALGSMLAEFTVLSGGIGLSGVVYGLWGMLWVLERHDPRFANTVDQATSKMFIGWFFLCILLTVADVLPVANVAHGVGAVMGGLLGFVICGEGQTRLKSIAALTIILIWGILGSTVFWPRLNFSGFAEAEIEQAAVEAMHRNDPAAAVKLFERAVRMKNAPARAWYNLGVARQRVGKLEEAVVAFERAGRMPDASADMRKIADELKDFPFETITNR